MTCPMYCGRFSPRYRAMSTVMPIANCVTTKVTRFSTWLPVDTAERPEVEPKSNHKQVYRAVSGLQHQCTQNG